MAGDHVCVANGKDLETLGELLVPEADVAVLASSQVALVKRGTVTAHIEVKGHE